MNNEPIKKLGLTLLSGAALMAVHSIQAQDAERGPGPAKHTIMVAENEDGPRDHLHPRPPERRHVERTKRFEFHREGPHLFEGPVHEERDVIIRRPPGRGDMRLEVRPFGQAPWPPQPPEFRRRFEGRMGPGERKGSGPEGRIGHLQEAIRHLQAAGLEEQANHLKSTLEKLRRESREQNRPGSDEIERLRREHQELRNELNKVRRELEKLVEQERPGREKKRESEDDRSDK
jgi:hypothetical protein